MKRYHYKNDRIAGIKFSSNIDNKKSKSHERGESWESIVYNPTKIVERAATDPFGAINQVGRAFGVGPLW